MQDWYPAATQRPLALDHSSAGIMPRDLIVLHITEGTTAEGAISTFQLSKIPHRVSAHFVIARDGVVFQLVPLSRTAWHASQCNSRSVGIEHVALSDAGADQINRNNPAGVRRVGLPVTDAQYAASAALCAWLCSELHISCDRAHIRTHNEASPIDGHVLCCTGALDPDKLVSLAAAQPEGIPT